MISYDMFVDEPSWGTFIWFGVIPVAVFLGFRVVNVKVRDIVTINGICCLGIAGVIIIWVSSKRLCWKGFQHQLVQVTRMCVGDGVILVEATSFVIHSHVGRQKVMMPNICIVARTRRTATAAVIVVVITAR